MKRTNVYLEENQMQRLAEIAETKGVSSAVIMRRMLNFSLSLLDTEQAGDIEFVRQKMIEKKSGVDVDYQEEFQELAREKAIEYRNLQNNSARITNIVEGQSEIVEGLASVKSTVETTGSAHDARLAALELTVNELIDTIRSNQP